MPATTDLRVNSKAYFEHTLAEQAKVQASLRAQLEWRNANVVLPTVAANPQVFPFHTVAQRAEGGNKRASIGIFGCLEECDALAQMQARKESDNQKAVEKAAKKAAAAERKEQTAAAAAEAVTRKLNKENSYFACLQAREQNLAPCACGAADSVHC